MRSVGHYTEQPKAGIAVRSPQGEERILVLQSRNTLLSSGARASCNAVDAIRFVESHNEIIDLVLTDVLMPGMKGRELVERPDNLRSSF